MRILSLNVGLPREIVYKGASIRTGIFKAPIAERVMMRTLNLDGDRQADLTVHGGPFKAVYAYPFEHYDFWQSELRLKDLPAGSFGENFTTEGVGEEDLHIGDRYSIGSAIVMVRQPRMPCYKLAAKFERDDLIERFLVSGRSGVYFSVEQEGEVGRGDQLVSLSSVADGITIGEMNRLMAHDRYNRGLLEKAIATDALPETWRDYFLPRLGGSPTSR